MSNKKLTPEKRIEQFKERLEDLIEKRSLLRKTIKKGEESEELEDIQRSICAIRSRIQYHRLKIPSDTQNRKARLTSFVKKDIESLNS